MTDHPSTPPAPSLPPRLSAGHKGTFGTVSVFGGCARGPSKMIGAPALVALGALRAGCGLARIIMPSSILAEGLTITPSATGIALPLEADGGIIPHEASAELDRQCASAACIVVGPGLGAGPGVEALSLRAVMQDSVPVVVDADAINALAQIPEVWRDFHAAAVLTPHPGEYARIARALSINFDGVNPDTRELAAAELARRLGCIVVLKGAGTVVSSGHDTWVCTHGHPCLATAGTGDVLAGVIAGVIAQHARSGLSLFDAARAAVLAHACAGEAWARDHHASGGLLAPELAGFIPAEIEQLRASRG